MFSYEKELNKEQLRVVYDGEGHCLVLSGPGSGKTRTLVYRVAYLLENGVSPSRILLLTFTKKASNEMLSRVYSLFPQAEEKILGGTFHHVANFFLRRYAHHLKYSKNYTIIDEEDAKNILKALLKEEGIDFIKPQVVQKMISLSINSQKEVEEVAGRFFPYFKEKTLEKLEIIKKKYEGRKKKTNIMDYDDLLLNWEKILSFPEIKKEISEKFLYVLVDEYQDTNALQNKIIRKLGSVHKNILVVGDDSQCIYSFRAAEIENIISFSKKYPKTKIFRLEKNYRSTPEILSAANAVISKNSMRLEKELKSVVPMGSPPCVFSFSSPFEEARFVTKKLKEYDLKETAVLFRAHYHAVELEMELARQKIPYILRGGTRFFEQFHVKDVLAFLRLFLNFYDEPSWRRILLRQNKIGEASVTKIIPQIFKKKSFQEVFKEKESIFSLLSSPGKKSLEEILQIFLKAGKEEISEKIKIFLNNFYFKYLEFSFDNARERKSDLKKLYDISLEYKDLEKMLSEFSLSEDFKKETEREKGLVLSTVHQAKGLEWKNVFLISLREGDFPHEKSTEEGLMEEERRLFYVAITRCKENLYLTHSCYGFGGKSSALPSRFLRESFLQENSLENLTEIEEIIEDEDLWESF